MDLTLLDHKIKHISAYKILHDSKMATLLSIFETYTQNQRINPLTK